MREPTLSSIEASSKQNASYSGVRSDILCHLSNSKRVLDVGCNVGALARAVKSLDSNVQFWGIDINLAAVEEAKPWMEEAVCINLDNINQLSCFLSGKTFDTIVAADVLEHTTNPWLVASHLLRCLEPKGRMVVSLPNLGHWEIYVHLFKQYFPRRQRGIFDNTHMRFFLANNLDEFSLEGFKVRIVQRNYRLFESGASQPWDHILSRLVRYIPWLREFFVFQWVFYIQADSSEQQ